MAEETQELTAPGGPEGVPAPLFDDQAMIVAYAALPLLVDVADHIVAKASRFGHYVARYTEAAIEGVSTASTGVRVFNGPLVDAPTFIPEARDSRDLLPAAWEAPGPDIKPDGTKTVAGLIWPLPGSRWQVVHLIGDGTEKRETISTVNRYYPDMEGQ